MKCIKLMLTAGLIAGTALAGFGQDLKTKDVPEAAKLAFKKNFPKAKDIEWERAGDDYKVDFEIAHVDYTTIFTPDGKTVMSQKEVAPATLPKSIAADIRAKYPQARIDDVEQINTGGKISYKIDLDGTPDATLYYSAGGKFINAIAD